MGGIGTLNEDETIASPKVVKPIMTGTHVIVCVLYDSICSAKYLSENAPFAG